MRKWVLRTLGLTLVLALFLMGATSVLAAGPEGPTPMSSADIEIDVESSGNWTLKFGNVDLGLSSQNVASLAQRFALGSLPLAIDQGTLSLATDNGIQHLALLKDGSETTIFINGIPSTALTISDFAVQQLAETFAPELEGLISWLNGTSVALVVHFPVAESSPVYTLDLEQKIAAAGMAGQYANVVDLGVTLTPDGRLISVAGIAPSELGLDLGMIDMSWMKAYGIDQLGIKQLDLALDGSGVTVSSNGDTWMSLAWNADYVAQNVPQVSRLIGFPMADSDMQIVDLAMSWLNDTQVHVGAYLADQPQESAPVVKIGRPVALAVQGKALYVEGFNTGFMLDDFTLGYAEQLGSVGLMWDGANRQLRMVIGDEPMPALVLDEGLISSVGTMFVGDMLPWGLVESIIGDTTLAAGFVYEDNPAVTSEALAYQLQSVSVTSPLMADVTISRADGRIAVLGEALPLDMLTGMDVSGIVKTYAGGLGGSVDSLAVDLGPNGLNLGLNGKNARLAWDSTTRANVVGLTLDIVGEQMGLPVLSSDGLVRWAIESLIAAGNQVDVGLNVNFTDQETPTGSIEELLALIGF